MANTAAFLGSQVYHSWGDYFCHGGPGYVLNKAAVRRLISEVLPKCNVVSLATIVGRHYLVIVTI